MHVAKCRLFSQAIFSWVIAMCHFRAFGRTGTCNLQFWERFESWIHFISRLSMIVQVKVVLNRTVIVDSDWRFDNLCGQIESKWVDGIKLFSMLSNCIYNERVSGACLRSTNPRVLGDRGRSWPLLSSAFNLGSVVLNFAVWRDCLQKALFAPPSPVVAVTTSLSLAAYLCQGSRGFLAILISSFHGLR